MRAIVIDRLDGGQEFGFRTEFPPGVGIPIKTWEIAAGHFEPDAVPGFEDVAGGPEVNRIGVDRTWRNGLGVGGGLTVAGPDNTVGQVLRKATGMHVHELRREIGIYGR